MKECIISKAIREGNEHFEKIRKIADKPEKLIAEITDLRIKLRKSEEKNEMLERQIERIKRELETEKMLRNHNC